MSNNTYPRIPGSLIWLRETGWEINLHYWKLSLTEGGRWTRGEWTLWLKFLPTWHKTIGIWGWLVSCHSFGGKKIVACFYYHTIGYQFHLLRGSDPKVQEWGPLISFIKTPQCFLMHDQGREPPVWVPAIQTWGRPSLQGAGGFLNDGHELRKQTSEEGWNLTPQSEKLKSISK